MEIVHETDGQEGRLSDLVSIIRDTIRRRWLTLVLVTLTIFTLCAVFIFMMTPQYESQARVRIDPSRNPLSTNAQADQSALNPEAIETEVAAISSLDLARDVVKKLNLDRDPEFTKGLSEKSGAQTLSQDERQTVVAQAVQRNLSVGRDKLTYLIGIKYSSRDPLKAAQIANAYAQAYVETKVGSKVNTAERQAEWFQQRLDTLGDEVRAADERVAQYRANSGLSDGTSGAAGGTIVDQQVGPLSSQLATAESDAAAARAALNAANGQAARGGLDSVGDVRSSAVITDLRRQRADTLRAMGEVSARYGEKHPESLKLRDQLETIDSQIDAEAKRVMGSLQAASVAAEARAASLRGTMGGLESGRARNTRASVMAESLEREAAAKRAAYEKLSQMSIDTTQAARNSISQAVIIDSAQASRKPSFPNKPIFLSLAAVIALAVGFGTIAVQEMMVSGMRSVDDVETLLGIPMLAAVPQVGKVKRPADLLLEKPTSLFAESLRIARAAMLGVHSADTYKVIAITSALPSEGKTTTSLAFARTLAINGSRTLLLDCDVRRAAMREIVDNPSNGPGIVEVLSGEATLDKAIMPGDIEGLDHMLVRSPYFSSGDLFGDGQMKDILDSLRGRYDKIVLDLPPLVGLADGRFLAAMADATALAVRWNSTPPQAAASAVAWLKSDGANPVGVIYTMVDTSSEVIGGLYYSKKYSAYYQQN